MVKSVSAGLTAERLRSLLHYDPATGTFTRLVARGGQSAGSIAGCLDVHGYWTICVDYKHYKAHDLAWLYVHGEWPSDELDHHDLVRHHNWIYNLRLASQTLNNANRLRYRNNQSGFKGVYLHQGRFRAMIRKDGRGIHIGCYDEPEEAHAAYVAKARELFGEFANVG